MRSVSIIGATSPLGVSLVPFFAAAGWSVNASYRDPHSIPQGWEESRSVSSHFLDLTEAADTSALEADVTVWLSHIDAGRFNAAEVELNLNALRRFLDERRPRRFIFISSGGSVYGSPETIPITEDHRREPLSSYGRAKRAMEDEIAEFGKSNALSTAIIRPGNIYGFERPDRKCKGVTAAFLHAVDDGTPFTLVHGGRTVRDFVHVDDVCRAIVMAAETEAGRAIWNVGTGVGTSTRDFIDALRTETGVPMPQVVEQENFTSDVLANVLSYERIDQELGWQPKIAIPDGVKRTIKHWRSFKKGQPASTES